MSWLDRAATPMYHTTGNHTTYDEMSEGVFREVLDLPHNGPPGQEGLSYRVRRGDGPAWVRHEFGSHDVQREPGS